MRAHIDWTRCDGQGACAELLPDVFTVDEWGYPLSDQRAPRIEPAQHARAVRARKACPRQAFRLIDE